MEKIALNYKDICLIPNKCAANVPITPDVPITPEVPIMVEVFNTHGSGLVWDSVYRKVVIKGIETKGYDDSSTFRDDRPFKVTGTELVTVPERGVGLVEKTCFVLEPGSVSKR